ncbi:MAG: outer membrane beta-barrel protein, partial [Verrucomicrobiota bacterium]
NTVSADINRRFSRRLSGQAGISYNLTEYEFAGSEGDNPETRNLQLNAGGSYILTASSAVTATVTWNSLESDLRSGRNDSSNRLRTMLAYQYTF